MPGFKVSRALAVTSRLEPCVELRSALRGLVVVNRNMAGAKTTMAQATVFDGIGVAYEHGANKHSGCNQGHPLRYRFRDLLKCRATLCFGYLAAIWGETVHGDASDNTWKGGQPR